MLFQVALPCGLHIMCILQKTSRYFNELSVFKIATNANVMVSGGAGSLDLPDEGACDYKNSGFSLEYAATRTNERFLVETGGKGRHRAFEVLSKCLHRIYI